jgi:hypothetical protein
VAGTDDIESTAVPPTVEAASETAPKKRAPKKAKATPADPEALAAEIERTREDLAETLDAIAEKVSPKRVAKRTTKKVTSAVKETAHDAATAVKDGAHTAKDKVSGGSRSDQSWAPAASRSPAGDAAAPPGEESVVRELPSTEPLRPSYSAPASVPPSGPLVKPEYVAVGAAAALIAWWLVRRRR